MAFRVPFTSAPVVNGEAGQSLQQQRHHNILPSNQFSVINNSSANHSPLGEFTSSLQNLSDMHQQEIDQFLQFENERLRLTIRQLAKNQIMMLKSKLEQKTAVFLKSKDNDMAMMKSELEKKASMMLKMKETEIATIKKKYQDLCRNHQEMLLQLKITTQQKELWQKIGKDASFGRIPEELRSCGSSNNVPLGGVGYTGSCSSGQARDKNTQDASQFGKVLSPCKACGSAEKSMLLLPCRHLCACKNCAASLHACPVCNCSSTGYFEVLMD